MLGVLGVLGLLLGVLLLEPLELGEEVLLPEPMPLELGDVVLPAPVALPVPPAAEPVLKYSSHSEREICPSLFLSTIEKLGASLLAPLEALLPLDMPEDPDELVDGVALGEDLSGLPEAPVEDDPELCAIDTLAIAKSAAAVAVPTSFNNIWRFLLQQD